jgi:hypothetical protein
LPVLTLYRPKCAGDAADNVCSPVCLFGSLVMHPHHQLLIFEIHLFWFYIY